MGLTIKKNGDVIVTEYEDHRIKIFRQEMCGEITTIGSVGVGAGKFACPRGVAVDQDENILVADSHNHRIQVVSSTDKTIGAFGMIGSYPGYLDTLYNVSVLPNANIIVADTKNHRLQVFGGQVPFYAEPSSCNEVCEISSVED